MHGRVKIFTHGCQMNDLDSQKLYSELARQGYQATDDDEAADLVILNTCSVRQKAQEKAVSTLGRLRVLKRHKPGLVIAVAGCVAQQEGAALAEHFPEVDIVIGTHQLHKLCDLVAEALTRRQPRIETAFGECIPSMDIVPDKAFLSPGHRAYLNIMQGCDNYCTYCIVPMVRGREISRDHAAILSEVRLQAGRGVKEIFLLGQNVNSYAGGVPFPQLLKEIHSVDGIERLRFTTSHPKDVSPELIECFAVLPKLCSHLHLPFQAGSDRVLKAMNRNYTYASYLKLIEDLRRARPDMAFSADVMVGFPGESDSDFQRTLALIKVVRFDVLYSFKYSPRPGTAADSLADDVALPEKSARLDLLQSLQKRITLENNQARLDKVYEVLVDGPSPRHTHQVFGRTTHGAIINFAGSSSLIGETVAVKVTRANQNSLTGELI
ncbi:MAG: tRNA (N6-isopentenyl adenosine(37)-C2)-methylthiotransferase MiaB [Syntrophaceae bacterium]